MSRNVLVVDDERALTTSICDRLRSEGYRAESAWDGDSGLSKAQSGSFDCILVDMIMPGQSGIEMVRSLRIMHVTSPVIFLSAKAGVSDKVSALRVGGDDYLTKPCVFEELLAHIEARMRRAAKPRSSDQTDWLDLGLPDKHFGPFCLSYASAELRINDRVIPTTHREFRLLAYLLMHRGEAVRQSELLEMVWGYESSVTSDTLYVHIAWIRRKLRVSGEKADYIDTVRNIGYRFRA